MVEVVSPTVFMQIERASLSKLRESFRVYMRLTFSMTFEESFLKIRSSSYLSLVADVVVTL